MKVIVVLASQPDVKTWEFPKQVYECLDRAIKLHKETPDSLIVVSGDRSISIDNHGLTQPFRECDKMADYLIEHGVADKNIVKENESRDTISNLYFIKTKILLPKQINNVIFPVADFRIPRLKFLCDKILGPDYSINYKPISAEVGPSYNEDHTWKVHELFLESMKPGDHTFLNGKFYDSWMYYYWKERTEDRSRTQHSSNLV